MGDPRNKRTTVSVTNGVGVQPRGGVRSKEGAEIEKHREATAGRRDRIEARGMERARR